MKFMRIIKYAAITIGVILAFIVAFFFWSTQHNWEEDDYIELVDIQEVTCSDVQKDSFTIMTYNLGYLSGMTNNTSFPSKDLVVSNQNSVKEEINKLQPDILAIQEIDYDADRSYHMDQSEIIGGDSYKFHANVVNWDVRYVPFPYWPPSANFGQVVSGQSIFSKYRLYDQDRIALCRVESEPFWRDAYYLDRLAQVVKVEIAGRELVVINVHLEAWDIPTRIKQQKEVIELWNKYVNDYPLILLGDFNSDPVDENASILELLKLEGVQIANLPSSNYEKTFPSNEPVERLDYIFFNDRIKCNSSRVLTEFGQASDHLPMLMNFSFN